mgnify:CR=1 FL=1
MRVTNFRGQSPVDCGFVVPVPSGNTIINLSILRMKQGGIMRVSMTPDEARQLVDQLSSAIRMTGGES